MTDVARYHDLILVLCGVGIGTLATLAAIGVRRLERWGRG